MNGGLLSVVCPAKVNLELHVLGRRTDGFHELDTVFQAVDLWDELSIGPSDELVLECDAPGIPIDDRNLVLRAALLLRGRHHAGVPGARFRLRKSIPVQAGLGGGSSNAAAALLLCDRHWGLGMARADLEAAARELGSDVPYFLTGGTARGRGRGDRVDALPFVGEGAVLLGCPPFGIPTSEVFGRVSARLTRFGNGVSVPILSAHKWPEDNDFGFLANDLEAVVFEGWPELKVFRDALLEAGARAALLSGSGSTVYGVFPGSAAAARAAKPVRTRFPQWRVIETRFVQGGVRWT